MKKKRDEIEELEDLDELDELEDEEEFDDFDEDEDEDDEVDLDMDLDDEDEKPSKKKNGKPKKKASKKKKIITAVIVVLLVAVLGVGGYFVYNMFFAGPSESQVVRVTSIDFKMTEGSRTLAKNVYKSGSKTNTFDIAEVLNLESGATVTEKAASSAASISGKNITVKGTGTYDVTITDSKGSKDYTLTIVDGVNVSTQDDLIAAVEAKEVVVMQKDIDLDKKGLVLFANVYGNAYLLNATNLYGEGEQYWQSIIYVGGDVDITIKDLHVTGYKIPDGEGLALDIALSRHGMLINAYGEGETNLTIDHCFIENGHRGVFISGSNVNMKESIVRNCADATISVETKPGCKPKISLKNNIICNAKVAGMLFWGYTGGDSSNYPEVTIEGYLDIYNWKSTSDAAIMPETENMHKSVNNMIKSSIEDEANASFAYMEDGNKYIHCAIVIISTGSLKDNVPTFTGLDKIGYTQRKLPMPAAAKAIVHNPRIIGYVESPAPIGPKDTI